MPPIVTLARATFISLTLTMLVACADTRPAADPAVPSASPPAVPSSDAQQGEAISINRFAFTPENLSVPAGTTVTWTNDEDSLHTVTSGTPESPSGLFDTGEIDTGVEFPFTFDEPGSYPFFCARHDFMTGEITVTP